MNRQTLKTIQRISPDFDPAVAFDVGSFAGDVTKLLLENYPSIVVHSFEPAPITFDSLRMRFEGNARTILNAIALDRRDGSVEFSTGRKTGNYIIRNSTKKLKSESVPAYSGDSYMRRSHVDFIDILKIDTEGAELEVLCGFSCALRDGKIRFLEVECTTHQMNDYHVKLTTCINFLGAFGYNLCDLYEWVFQDNERGRATRAAWFCNALFTSEHSTSSN